MLTKLRTITSQYKVFIFLAALIPLLGFVLIWQQTRLKVPPPNPIFGNLPPPETQFSIKTEAEVSYQFSLPQNAFAQFPPQMNVYKIKRLSDQEIINEFAQIASELGFSTKPKVQALGELSFYVWKEGNSSLEVDSQSGQFIFKGNFPLTLGLITPQEAENLIKEKLAGLKLLSKEAPATVNYFAIAGLELEPVINPNIASVYEIVFSSSIGGYPLIGLGPAQDVAFARVTKKGQLIALNYFLHRFDQEKVGTYPMKPAGVALTEIQQGQGKILSAKTQTGIETNVAPDNPIKAVNLASVDLVYYESVEKQEYLQPLYLFSGGATLKDDTVLEVFLYLPAVSSEWLIQTSPTPASRFKVE